jgi:hypothetical protein
MELEWIPIGDLQVDARVLENRTVGRCRNEECRAMCCSHGVYLDLADAGRIVDEAESIKRHLPEEFHDIDNWFDGDVSEDSDFPSGYRVGTQVVPDPGKLENTSCVFLRPDNKCALQVASLAQGRHPWDLKPFYCALYPLILLGDKLQLDDDNSLYRNGASCQRPEPELVPLYRLLKDELMLGLGEDGYRQLCAVARQHNQVTR